MTLLITPTPISVASATMRMNPHVQTSFASTALLMSLTYVPVFLSTLSFYPELFTTHPIQRFLLGLAPWWMAYLSARWYVRLAEQSSSLYHPLGCLAQCCVWVFHWVVSLYHAYFGEYHTVFVELALNILPPVKSQSTPYGHTSSPYSAQASWSSQRECSTALSRWILQTQHTWVLMEGYEKHMDEVGSIRVCRR